MERSPNTPQLRSAPRDFRGRRVTVMGLGTFGGGEGVVRFLSERGARVTVTDQKSEPDLAETLARLEGCPIEALHLGGHVEDDFREAELVVVNPSVPRSNRFLEISRAAGVELTSEMNLFIELNRGRIAAVTGSIGKSTTTALLERMLAAAGMKTWLGGNIGRSLLPEVDSISADDWVVLELSSFQLADLDRIRFRPDVAVVTNFRANHLDWHQGLEDYRWAKQTILRDQTSGDTAVLNADDPDVSTWNTDANVVWFGRGEKPGFFEEAGLLRTPHFSINLRDEFSLPGQHHALNAAAATAASVSIGADEAAVRSALRLFTSLPHRLQFLGEHHGRRFYDDSKATTPEAAIAALESFEEPVVLLAGGYDKHVDLGPFARMIASRAKAVALMGDTARILEAGVAAERSPDGSRLNVVPYRICATFDEAIGWALQQSQPGDVVLLSPGCASYDWFNNYVERGESFATAIRIWAERMSP